MRTGELPAAALLLRYRQGGGHTDCYFVDVGAPVSHARYVEAFYTTPLFKVERLLLRWFASRPATDRDATALAHAQAETFSAWRVEGRAPDQLLLADFTGRTRSWLMTQASGQGTRLFFGSAVVPRIDRATGERRMGWTFHALMGFHRLYSRALLAAARRRLA